MTKAHIPLKTGPNANKIDTKKRKCTWPMRKMLHLGFSIGVKQTFKIRFGGNANFSVFRYQHLQSEIVALGV